MAFNLPDLPYSLDALEPYISKKTLSYHYEKHHKGYIEKINQLVEGTPFAKASLENIIKKADGKILENGAQAWNHTFYWNCMAPKGEEPSHALQKELAKNFGSWEDMKDKCIETANELFGSGWVWLTLAKNGKLVIEARSDEGNPLRDDKKPLLTCDIWEHAYYLDYQNEKEKYFKAFFKIINWRFVEKNLNEARR
jgi:Fe-Mn family superoxide dismutase